jgi:xylulokinase
MAEKFSLRNDTIISYKAGDQPNNALALNVFSTGEVMANAGTSGVIYSISEKLTSDPESKINSFAHVNYDKQNTRIGQLLCINGGGITSAWMRSLAQTPLSYSILNERAAIIPEGADGLACFPFGNGTERMFGNINIGAQLRGINYAIHKNEHMYRAGLEGVAFSFKYGLELLQELGTTVKVIRAAKANMFLSEIFISAFVNTTGIPLELYQTDGSWGAAIGAGIGKGQFTTETAFEGIKPVQTISPDQNSSYPELYKKWKSALIQILQIQNKNSTNE